MTPASDEHFATIVQRPLLQASKEAPWPVWTRIRLAGALGFEPRNGGTKISHSLVILEFPTIAWIP